MEHIFESALAALLIVAWVIAIRSFGRSLPHYYLQLKKSWRRLIDEARYVLPDMVAGIENAVRMLRRELGNLFPVFSAESIENLEGEFIRDLLPKRFSLWIALLAILALGGLAWWISR